MERTKLSVAGSFECVVEKPESGWFGETGTKKTPYIRIPVIVTDEGPQNGHYAIYYGWLSDGAFDNTIARLAEVFGFNGDLPALHEEKITLEGLPCNITVEEEVYEGKKKIKVAWLNQPGGGGGATPMEEGKVQSLLKKLGPKAKAVAKAQLQLLAAGGGRAKPKADGQKLSEAPQADSPADDEVPF